MTAPHIQNRQLLATCWTWAGDAAPARGDERSPVSIHDRVAAVAAAGWSGVGLVHADLMPLQDELGYSGLRSLITDAGLQHIELEFISNWWATGELRAASDQVRRDLFTAAAELGVTTIKVGAQLTAFGTSDLVGPEAFAEAFDALATDAGNHGVRVALEPMPMSNLQTLQAGIDFVTGVDNPHGGLVVDTWHVRRGGTPNESLPDILPMDKVFVVELDDAAEQVQGSLWEDTINNRLNPGQGALDTAGFVAAVHRAGWAGHWGVEIISNAQRAKPVAVAVRDTYEACMATFDAAEKLLG